MSERSASPSDTQENPSSKPAVKRKATAAGLDGTGTQRAVKRRASKACQCCRARKVRCNVTEHGAPCTNCRLDEVECIVSESRRKKKWTKDNEQNQPAATSTPQTTASSQSRKLASRDVLDGLLPPPAAAAANPRASHDAAVRHEEHVPHAIYQTHSRFGLDYQRRLSVTSQCAPLPVLGYSPLPAESRQAFFPQIARKPSSVGSLPPFIKPLPAKIGPDEIAYLEMKGALTLPNVLLRNQLLRAYVEFVHPYMPLLDLNEFLTTADAADGSRGKVSLILFQAVMFAGSAFAEMRDLRIAGYRTRKEARKDFFQKTRLLYDFDYESDRLALVQALLLLTYYYETPDDQKDTWHWMGVATSVAHTIGLHRNPEKTHLDPKKTKLWKRIWWSTYMRDRLIALGMRRPTRIKAEDYDVPMLSLDDFEISALPDSVTCISSDCTVARDTDKQRQLAIMCIEKAKLCLCISHVLSKQYCVLNNQQGPANDRTTMMLLPKKLDPEKCEVKACDEELQKWVDLLPEEAKYREESSGNPSIDLHRALLQMIFYTTLSALHRPQVLPSAPTTALATLASSELLEMSRRNVRRAANAITAIAVNIDSLGLVRFLPTTGVTVLLPAIIIHLLDIKAPEEDTRRNSLRGFCQCMQVLGKLRDLYAAADYSTAFLEAAIRKAGISIPPISSSSSAPQSSKLAHARTLEDLVDAGRRMDMIEARNTLTPPPESRHIEASISKARAILIPADTPLTALQTPSAVTDEEVARRLESFLASTPPDSDHHADEHSSSCSEHDPSDPSLPAYGDIEQYSTNDVVTANAIVGADMLFANFPTEFDEGDFDNLLNMDAIGEGICSSGNAFGSNFEEANMVLQSEGNGLISDGDWMKILV